MDNDGFIIAGCKKRRQYTNNQVQRDISIKRILCQNMNKYGTCSYNDKCMYAHNLKEQVKDYEKEFIYDLLEMIIKKIDVSKYIKQIEQNEKLKKSLITFTRVCFGCKNKTCFGGYNCKNGAIDERYVVCYDDLIGNCRNINCSKIHLSKYGLVYLDHEYNMRKNNRNTNNDNKCNRYVNIGSENENKNTNILNKDANMNISNENINIHIPSLIVQNEVNANNLDYLNNNCSDSDESDNELLNIDDESTYDIDKILLSLICE